MNEDNKDQQGSPDGYATERRKMSDMMISSAEDEKAEPETSEPILPETVTPKEPEVSEASELSQEESKPDSIFEITPASVNKPLALCYPEIADDKDEELLADVRRFWLGRLGIITTGAVLILLLFGFMIATPSLIRGLGYGSSAGFKAAVGLVTLIIAALVALGTFTVLWIYNRSRMLITNENVIEVRQMSLFSRKVSHLNMINVEDVTVVKRGIFQTAFNYGTLQIETAGEKDNFSFPSTPSPDIYRRMVITAHEAAIERIGKMGSAQRVELTHNGF